MRIDRSHLDLILLEDSIWVVVGEVGLPSYDFPLSQFFACRHPWQRPDAISAIGRFGAATNYDELYAELAAEGILLIHSPAQHQLASELPQWYPLLAGLTPQSLWFAEPPSFTEIERQLGLPLFLKGSRQTSRHRAVTSIIRSAADYDRAIEIYRQDPILQWQDLVCREFIPLRPVPSPPSDKIPASFEFRSFWWHGKCVGAGQYWSTNYDWDREEERAALAISQTAALRLNLPFVVIDVAQNIDRHWIVIECNDAQESGYAAVSPFGMWQNIIAAKN